MKTLKALFTPFKVLNKQTIALLISLEAAVALVAWHISGNNLIPSPLKVISAFFQLISSGYFIDNLFSSLSLVFEGMSISIVVALIISYLSLIPFFRPIAVFIIKCRYLTLTGLIFLFTILTSNGHNLKISLLIFGIVPFFVTSLLSIIDEINSQEYELCQTLRMNSWRTLLEVVIIGRLDQAIEVIRQNFAIAWMMITMVEGISMSEGGLGTMLIKSGKYIDLANVFSILFSILLIGILFDFLLGYIRKWLFPYTKIMVLN